MRRVIGALTALLLFLSSAAAEAFTPSMTIPVLTRPQILQIMNSGNFGKRDNPLLITTVEDDEENQAFTRKCEEQILRLAALKKACGGTGQPNDYVFQYFANTAMTQGAAENAGIAVSGGYKKTVTTTIYNADGEVVEVKETVEVAEGPAVTLEQVVSQIFGTNAELAVHEFTALQVEGYNADAHGEVTLWMSFATQYKQKQVIVMLGAFDERDHISWFPLVCDVADAKNADGTRGRAIEVTMDSETLRRINGGRCLMAIVSAAE